MGGSAVSEMDSNRGKTGRVGGSCRASQVELSGKQWDGRARGCGGKAGCGRRLLWVVINHSQQMSWSRRGGYRKKKLRRSLGDDKEWDWGRSGEEKNRRGRSTQTLSRRWDVSPASRCSGTGAGVGISDLPAGLQAEPERARLRHALQSQPRQRPSCSSSGCPGCSRRGQQGHPGHPRHPDSLPVQAAPLDLPRTWRRHCGSDARANGGRGGGGVARGRPRGGPGPCSSRPRPWPSSRGTSIFHTREGRLSFDN